MILPLLSKRLISFVPKALTSSFTSVINRPIHCLQRCTIPNSKPFMQPVLPLLVQKCGLKHKGKLKLRCKGCYFVVRKELFYVMCKVHPRHKQVQIHPKEHETWIVSHATQGVKRPW